MSDNSPPANGTHAAPHPDREYAVSLPCEPEGFAAFVSGLLGRPQVIERYIGGIFEIARDDVINIFHLVDQRIQQQNESALVQFTVQIVYDDNSSVLLNSLTDFEHYAEIRPVVSTGVVLSWTYLITFKNKRVPEKQEIVISFYGGYDVSVRDVDRAFMPKAADNRWFRTYIRISHTERTWGVDIESLLSGHAKTLLVCRQGTSAYVYENSSRLGWAVFLLVFVGSVLGVIVASIRFTESYLDRIGALGSQATDSGAALSAKIDFLIEMVSTGAWPRFLVACAFFLFAALLAATILGFWVSEKADNRPESWVLLSRAAHERHADRLRRMRRDWIMFWLSLVASIVPNVISNIIFIKYFGAIG